MKTFFRRHRAISIGLALVVLVLLALGGAWWTGLLDQPETVAWQPPRHVNLEVYLLRRDRLSLTPSSQGCKGYPNLSTISPEAHFKYRYTCGDSGKPPYEVEIEYLKRNLNGDDTYLVQCTIPVGNSTSRHTTEIISYSGQNLELFRDDHYVLGLRPGTDKKSLPR